MMYGMRRSIGLFFNLGLFLETLDPGSVSVPVFDVPTSFCLSREYAMRLCRTLESPVNHNSNDISKAVAETTHDMAEHWAWRRSTQNTGFVRALVREHGTPGRRLAKMNKISKKNSTCVLFSPGNPLVTRPILGSL
jgi:hypothetical protein